MKGSCSQGEDLPRDQCCTVTAAKLKCCDLRNTQRILSLNKRPRKYGKGDNVEKYIYIFERSLGPVRPEITLTTCPSPGILRELGGRGGAGMGSHGSRLLWGYIFPEICKWGWVGECPTRR